MTEVKRALAHHQDQHKLTKDNCRSVCAADPDGLPVDTLDDERFLVVNGVQTLAYACTDLIRDLGDLAQANVASLRLSPQHCDMVAVAGTFRDVLDGKKLPEQGFEELSAIYPNLPATNDFLKARPTTAKSLQRGPAA